VRIHANNTSAVAKGQSTEKAFALHLDLARGYEDLLKDPVFNSAQRRALSQRLAAEYFWILGYNFHWQSGKRLDALAMFRKGISTWPWDWRYWKTYVLALIRTVFTSPKGELVESFSKPAKP
jgi:hypothetical protein